MTDWNQIRADRFTKERPTGWPAGVYGISLTGLGLLGVHEQTNKLYWDGREIAFRRVKFGLYEQFIGTLLALATVGTFVVDAGKVLKWWGV